ncbi:hypothetical protein NPIL_150111 [Nephila pilipes]|uniref:Uncharacterized protein n=1 Tax=Nephila pilipes TaxID=299642 RepID=A0A8X6PR00_NEPPI|nr:hypothetical protein NPIL_150111 [Nephila pilipes]
MTDLGLQKLFVASIWRRTLLLEFPRFLIPLLSLLLVIGLSKAESWAENYFYPSLFSLLSFWLKPPKNPLQPMKHLLKR